MRKVVEQIVDDLTGEEIEAGAGRTVTFAVDGKTYELDLSNRNVEKFEKALQPYVEVARKTGASLATRTPARRSGAASAHKWSAGYSTVREWALANNIEVSPQGRVADSVMKAYEDAHK